MNAFAKQSAMAVGKVVVLHLGLRVPYIAAGWMLPDSNGAHVVTLYWSIFGHPPIFGSLARCLKLPVGVTILGFIAMVFLELLISGRSSSHVHFFFVGIFFGVVCSGFVWWAVNRWGDPEPLNS